MYLGNLSDREYNEIEAVRNTDLGLIKKSINHYLNRDEKESNENFRIGRAFHCFILEPEVFQNEAIILPNEFDRRSKERAAQYDEWERAGRIILKQKELDNFKMMRDSLMSHPFIKNVLKKSSNEGVYTANIEGVDCKVKIDIEANGFIFDLKTTTDASQAGMEKFITNFDTARQLTFYEDVYKENGKNCKGVGIIAIEKTAPFNCSINTVDMATLDHGRASYKKQLQKLAEYNSAKKEGREYYTGYSAEIGVLTAKQWYFYDE